MSHAEQFFKEIAETACRLATEMVEALCEELFGLRARGGSHFILGAGGSAGNSSHVWYCLGSHPKLQRNAKW
jgi:phosphoheptose isomerase